MKKRFMAAVATLAISLSSLLPVTPVAAAVEDVGAFDFYSITINYNKDILVSYDGEDFSGEDTVLSNQLVINSGTKTQENYYQVQAGDTVVSDMKFGKVKTSKGNNYYGFITHITNGSAIVTKDKIDLFGITEAYDKANPYVNQNPNIQYADDGYAYAEELKADGTNYKLDVNGFLVEDDFIWRTGDNQRVELFIQVPTLVKKTNKKGKIVPEINPLSGVYEWVSFDERFDENGKVKNTKFMLYYYGISKDDYDAFMDNDELKEINLTRMTEEQYDGAARKGRTECYPQLILTSDTSFSKDKAFTDADIIKDSYGSATFGTPKTGTPLRNKDIQITDITVEIDALGAQLYDDLTADPQQKNTITVSLNDCPQNINLIDTWYKEGRYTEAQYKEIRGFVLASGKSQTTRTEIGKDFAASETAKEYDPNTNYNKRSNVTYSKTVKSIKLDINQDVLANLPNKSSLYICFDIQENQPAEAYDETYIDKMLSDPEEYDFIDYDQDMLTDADKPEVIVTDDGDEGSNSSTLPIGAIIGIVSGGVVVIAGIVVAIIIIKNKKGKKTEK